ncbi:MAG: NUDIX domain-containing protein [Candidatus Kerfeldbacteria bacterium]|nr:NUDIX domain-containing protein [Candidatus Kerfeldbacteria bacterium]
MRFNFTLTDSVKLFQVWCLGIIEQAGKVVLVQSAEKSMHGRWTLPGAQCVSNQSVISTTEQAIWHQLGLGVSLKEVVGWYRVPAQTGTYGSWLVACRTNLRKGALTPRHHTILNASWFSYNQIFRMPRESFCYSTIRTIIKDYRKGQQAPLTSLKDA